MVNREPTRFLNQASHNKSDAQIEDGNTWLCVVEKLLKDRRLTETRWVTGSFTEVGAVSFN